MNLSTIIYALAFATVSSSGAWPQAPAPSGAPGPDWAVPEVVVRAPAPRLWKLTRGASTVYVLGVVEPLPKGQAWNIAQVTGILSRADRLIVRPYATVGLLGGFQALRRAHLPGGQSLDDELSPELREQLHGTLVRLGRDPKSLNHYKAAWAALDLERGLRDAGKLTDAEPGDTLLRIAHQKRVPIKEAGRYDGSVMLKQYANIPEDQGRELLQRAVLAVEHQLDAATTIGHAWAVGDLRTLRRVEGPSASLSTLLKAASAGQAFSVRADEDIVVAIDAALSQTGVSVTAFQLDGFARRGGAIDRLRTQGVVVTEPTE